MLIIYIIVYLDQLERWEGRDGSSHLCVEDCALRIWPPGHNVISTEPSKRTACRGISRFPSETGGMRSDPVAW